MPELVPEEERAGVEAGNHWSYGLTEDEIKAVMARSKQCPSMEVTEEFKATLDEVMNDNEELLRRLAAREKEERETWPSDDWEETIQAAEEHVPWPEDWAKPIEMRAYFLANGFSEEEADTIVQSFDDMLQGRGVVLYRPPKGETDENPDRG